MKKWLTKLEKKRGTNRVMKHVMHGGYVKVKSERIKYQELFIHVSSQLLPIVHTAHRPHDTRIQPKPSQQKKKIILFYTNSQLY